MTNKTILSLTVFSVLFMLYGCVTARPVSYYRPTAQNQENLTIDEWIERGDAFYFRDDYDNAKECYFRALMDDPARTDVLNSYGVTLANTGFYENAIVIFNFASRIDPSNETVQDNISFCRQQIAIRTEQQRQLQLQAQQQQQEIFNNLIASLNTLASSIQQQQQRQSGGSGGSSGGQASSSSSSNNSSSSNSSSSNSTPKKDHDFCHGTGWVYKSDEPNYTGGTQPMEWCKYCQKNRYPHYHTRCPGCNGTGKVAQR